MSAERQEQHDRELAERNFKISILEQRVSKNEEQALKKYSDMSKKLKNEPILAAHFNK